MGFEGCTKQWTVKNLKKGYVIDFIHIFIGFFRTKN